MGSNGKFPVNGGFLGEHLKIGDSPLPWRDLGYFPGDSWTHHDQNAGNTCVFEVLGGR